MKSSWLHRISDVCAGGRKPGDSVVFWHSSQLPDCFAGVGELRSLPGRFSTLWLVSPVLRLAWPHQTQRLGVSGRSGNFPLSGALGMTLKLMVPGVDDPWGPALSVPRPPAHSHILGQLSLSCVSPLEAPSLLICSEVRKAFAKQNKPQELLAWCLLLLFLSSAGDTDPSERGKAFQTEDSLSTGRQEHIYAGTHTSESLSTHAALY